MTPLLLIAMLVAGPAGTTPLGSDPSPLMGSWAGFVNVSPGTMEVDFLVRVTELRDDSAKGALVFPTQGKTEHALTFASAYGDQVTFEIRDEKGIVTLFSGHLSKDRGSVEGEAMQGGEKHPFSMHRAESELWTHPEAKPSLVELGGSTASLRETFNRDARKVRLLLILSPTCGLCRMGARMTARYILDLTQRDDLRVYVVWEKVGKEDSAESAEEASRMLADSRVQQFWSPERVAGQAFKTAIGLTTQPAASVYLAFGADQAWSGEAPPAPRLFMHSSPKSTELPQSRLYNGKAFGEEIRQLLGAGEKARPDSPAEKTPTIR
jgi:hypothetical protein